MEDEENLKMIGGVLLPIVFLHRWFFFQQAIQLAFNLIRKGVSENA